MSWIFALFLFTGQNSRQTQKPASVTINNNKQATGCGQNIINTGTLVLSVKITCPGVPSGFQDKVQQLEKSQSSLQKDNATLRKEIAAMNRRQAQTAEGQATLFGQVKELQAQIGIIQADRARQSYEAISSDLQPIDDPRATQAQALIDAGKFEEVEALLKPPVAAGGPSVAPLQFVLGTLYNLEHRYEDANDEYAAAHTAFPLNTKYACAYAASLAAIGQLKTSIKVYDAAIPQLRKEAQNSTTGSSALIQALALSALAHASIGDLKVARKLAEEAVSRLPANDVPPNQNSWSDKLTAMTAEANIFFLLSDQPGLKEHDQEKLTKEAGDAIVIWMQALRSQTAGYSIFQAWLQLNIDILSFAAVGRTQSDMNSLEALLKQPPPDREDKANKAVRVAVLLALPRLMSAPVGGVPETTVDIIFGGGGTAMSRMGITTSGDESVYAESAVSTARELTKSDTNDDYYQALLGLALQQQASIEGSELQWEPKVSWESANETPTESKERHTAAHEQWLRDLKQSDTPQGALYAMWQTHIRESLDVFVGLAQRSPDLYQSKIAEIYIAQANIQGLMWNSKGIGVLYDNAIAALEAANESHLGSYTKQIVDLIVSAADNYRREGDFASALKRDHKAYDLIQSAAHDTSDENTDPYWASDASIKIADSRRDAYYRYRDMESFLPRADALIAVQEALLADKKAFLTSTMTSAEHQKSATSLSQRAKDLDGELLKLKSDYKEAEETRESLRPSVIDGLQRAWAAEFSLAVDNNFMVTDTRVYSLENVVVDFCDSTKDGHSYKQFADAEQIFLLNALKLRPDGASPISFHFTTLIHRDFELEGAALAEEWTANLLNTIGSAPNFNTSPDVKLLYGRLRVVLGSLFEKDHDYKGSADAYAEAASTFSTCTGPGGCEYDLVNATRDLARMYRAAHDEANAAKKDAEADKLAVKFKIKNDKKASAN